jgi:hypothetical protein|tara:strand:- start:459 stop:566 length:108 start_codon:yes stop_codon:yes gene_type:complete
VVCAALFREKAQFCWQWCFAPFADADEYFAKLYVV